MSNSLSESNKAFNFLALACCVGGGGNLWICGVCFARGFKKRGLGAESAVLSGVWGSEFLPDVGGDESLEELEDEDEDDEEEEDDEDDEEESLDVDDMPADIFF